MFDSNKKNHRYRITLLVATAMIIAGLPHAAISQDGTFDVNHTLSVEVDQNQVGPVEVDWKRRTRAKTRVGWFCRDASPFDQVLRELNVLPLPQMSERIKTASSGCNNLCQARAVSAGEWDQSSNGNLTRFDLTISSSGVANPSPDQCFFCNGRARSAVAKCRATSQMFLRLPLLDNVSVPLSGVKGFAGEWVNRQGLVTKSRSKIVRDPVIARLFDTADQDASVIEKHTLIDVKSTVRGTGKTEMFNDGPDFVTIRNHAADMEFFLEIRSPLVDPQDHGVIHVKTENGIVTRSDRTGRFANVIGFPVVGTSQTIWQTEAFSMNNINFEIPAIGAGLLEIEFGCGAHAVQDEGLLSRGCSLLTDIGDGPDDTNLSVIPSGDSAYGFPANAGANTVMGEPFTVTEDTQLDFLVAPFFFEGAPSETSPTAAYVRIWDLGGGPPGSGGILLHGDLVTQRDMEAGPEKSLQMFRVDSGDVSNASREIHEIAINLEWVPVIPQGTKIGVEVMFAGTANHPVPMIPHSPFADPANDSAFTYSIVSDTWSAITDPGSGRPVCLPIDIYGTAVECYRYDDGQSENSLGHSANGDFLWGNYFNELSGGSTIESLSVAFGDVGVPVGTEFQVAIYEDLDDDGDPTTNLQLITSTSGTVDSPGPIGLETFQLIDVPDVTVSGGFFVAAYMDGTNNPFPAMLDTTTSLGQSWFAEHDTIGALDITNPFGTATLSGLVDNFGFPGNFLIRADCSESKNCFSGDVNGDGFVDLLDVAPFIDAISTGDFICEADVNGDGAVNLLDVAPFVALLTGG